MKRYFAPALVIAFVLTFSGRVRGDDFSDFRIPTHQALRWTGSFGGSWRGSTSDEVTSRERSGFFFGTTGSDLRRLTDGENGFTDLFLSAFLQGDRSSSTQSGYEQFPILARGFDNRSSGRSTAEQCDVDYSFGQYLGRAPITLGAEARMVGNLNQSWRESREHSSQIDFASSTDQLAEANGRRRQSAIVASLRPRVGLGRVRDASGVYIARVIEERLRRDGLLTRALTHETRQKLADLLTLGDAYDVLHARPAKGLWAEIERVLRDDGALAPGGLDASSTQHAGEPLLDAVRSGGPDGLPSTIVLRRRGATASAFVSGLHQRATGFAEGSSQLRVAIDGVPQPTVLSSFSDRFVTTTDAAYAGLEGEWYRPVGLRVQLDASAEASVPIRSQDDGVAARMNGLATWMVADRWLVQGSMSQRRDLLQNAKDGKTQLDLWTFDLVGQVIYEVEDHVTIQLGVRDDQTGLRGPREFPSMRQYRRDQSVTLGLSYRFAGRFNAPGFEALSRAMRPAAGI